MGPEVRKAIVQYLLDGSGLNLIIYIGHSFLSYISISAQDFFFPLLMNLKVTIYLERN